MLMGRLPSTSKVHRGIGNVGLEAFYGHTDALLERT